MFSEKMTYDKFMKDAYPELALYFDRYRHEFHDDLLPLWDTYKRKSLDYYQNAFQYSANKVTEAQVFGGLFEKRFLLLMFDFSVRELYDFFKKVSDEYRSTLHSFDTKLVSNYPLFYTDQELKTMIEGFIEAKKTLFTKSFIAQHLARHGVNNHVVHEWKLGEHLPGFRSLPNLPHKVQEVIQKELTTPINKALDDAIAYLKKKQSAGQQGISPSEEHSMSQDTTIITLRTMRSDLLRTLQSI